MNAVLREKSQIAEGTLYVELDLEQELQFTAGQFFSLTLPAPAFTDNRGNSRFLGFVNSPSRSKIAAFVVRLGPSAFKRSLALAPSGTPAVVNDVKGSMTLPADPSRPLVIITGGIGIAPYMSMFRFIKENSLSYPVTLIYSNTNRARAIFLDELSEYAAAASRISLVATMTRDPVWPGEKRRIDKQFLLDHLPKEPADNYFVSGTVRFVPAMVKLLREIGTGSGQVKFEIFTGY